MNPRFKAFSRNLLRDWGPVVGIALVMAVLGPYDTFAAMSPAIRVFFWLAAGLGTAVLVKACRRLLQLWPVTRHWPVLGLRLLATVLGSLPAAVLLSQLYRLLTSSPRADLGLAYLYVLLPTALFTVLLSSLSWSAPKPEAEPVMPGPSADPAATFVTRHAGRFAGAALLALEAEDHYLRVHTDRGSELILMRLRDAMAQLVTVPGLQVHRSFWVARAAVTETQRRGNGWQLILRNGLKVPVSRTYAAALREAGWLTVAVA